jgi:fructoselysine-6-P-deglycase FrlB-like protein
MPAQPAHPGGLTEAEVRSQPAVWRLSLDLLRQARALLVAPGERVLLIGCGTSAFVARSLAGLREAAGAGETHWAYASEMPRGRSYDRVIALTRSGTTTEVLSALAALPAGTHRVGVCAVPGMPVQRLVDDCLMLDFADEASVVQTRFPTTTVLLMRAALGEDVEPLIAAATAALDAPAPIDPARFEQFVFLSRGWGIGLADEAALKIRESAQAWAESYPALDYRHGPIAIASARSLVWILGEAPPGLAEEVAATGATVIAAGADPLIDLVGVHRLALALAAAKGLDPDRPHNLQRSVILPAAP